MMRYLFYFLLFFSFQQLSAQDNCRNRLSYLHFEDMTQKERLLWLNCAFERFKNGDDSSLKKYIQWSRKTPNYAEFKKLWAKVNDQ